MKGYIWLGCAILFVAGCGNYPQSVEFRVSGTDGAEFYYYIGDIPGNNYIEGMDTVPASHNHELEDEYEIVQGIFSSYYGDTLIIDLYVEDELIESAITTDLIYLYYPPFEECEICLHSSGYDSTCLSPIDLHLTGASGDYILHVDAPPDEFHTIVVSDTVTVDDYCWEVYRDTNIFIDSGSISITVPRVVLVECWPDTLGNTIWTVQWAY